MRLNEIKGREAIELLADLMEPANEIFSDKELAKAYRSKVSVFEFAKIMLKNHPQAVSDVLTIIDGEEPTILTLPAKLISLMNEPEFVRFFESQGQSSEDESFGSATENTEAKG